MTAVSSDYKTWDIVNNKSFSSPTDVSDSGTKDISALDFNKPIKLKFFSSAGTYSAGRLFSIKWGGAWLNYSNNGTYYSHGNITSKVIKQTAKNISAAKLNAFVYNPSNTALRFFLANNCNASEPTFESVILDQPKVFTTTGNSICWRATLNSTVNTTSPVIRRVEVSVTKSAIKNISFDYGLDGDNDWIYEGTLNASTSPKMVNASMVDINTYIQDNCANEISCIIPIGIITRNAGTLSIDVMNYTQHIDDFNHSADITLKNLSKIENIARTNITARFRQGVLQLYDLDIEFKGSKNISLFAHSYNDGTNTMGTANLSMLIYHSKHNTSFPKGIVAFELVPLSNNQTNITVVGQEFNQCNTTVDYYCVHSSTPIYNDTNLAYDDSYDLYVKMNDTYNKTFFNFSLDLGVNRTTPLQINSSYQHLKSGILPNGTTLVGQSVPIFAFVDFYAVNFSNISSLDLDFDFTTYCTKCVR